MQFICSYVSECFLFIQKEERIIVVKDTVDLCMYYISLMIAIDLNINPFASWGLVGVMATIVCAQLFLTAMLFEGLIWYYSKNNELSLTKQYTSV
jgi:hypothetical protein